MTEACTRAVYFVHLFNKTQTYNTLKLIGAYFLMMYPLLSLHAFTDTAMDPYLLMLILSLHYVGYSCLSSRPVRSTGGRGFDHYAH